MKFAYLFLWVVLWVGAVFRLRADVKLPSVISDHAVLQKARSVPIWGKADPDEKVTVTFNGAKAETQAGADGKWKVTLDLSASPQGPFELTVEGKNKLVISDVVVGEVWVCSGQSNMEFALKNAADAATELPNSTNSLLRQFSVIKTSVPVPQDDCKGAWVVASPETSGQFTAVGYYFGKKLQQELKTPVGLLHTSWGGSALEAWISEPTMDQFPDLKVTKDKLIGDIKSLPQRLNDFQTQYRAWETKYDRKSNPVGKPEDYAGVGVDTSTWKTVKLPGLLSASGLPDAGAIWIRRTITIPADKAGTNSYVECGIINQFDTVYWNGAKMAETTIENAGSSSPRQYSLNGKYVKAGDNVLAIRIFNPAGGIGINAEKAPFRVLNQPLNGDWLAKVESELPPLAAASKAEYPAPVAGMSRPPQWPTCLYNGMIHPLIPYAIRGVIWYQGETNAGRAYQYRTSFPTMIEDWRALWGQGEFPFYWCQLANYTAKKNVPGDSDWAELREAQTMTLKLKNSAQAILIDIGEADDIHPRNKKDAGERLSRIALAQTYGKSDIVFSGPLYKSMAVEGDKIRIQFSHADDGLMAQPIPSTYVPRSLVPKPVPLVRNSPQSELEGFAICGDDKQWKWANATIENGTVVVSSPEVAKPVAVRYAWANNPTCNLYNKAGLPGVPFRTDDFPAITLNKKF